jgi:aspartate racemase
MKTVGIIGGLGPETSSKFYLKLLQSCQKMNPIVRPEMLMNSVSMNLEVEKDFINGADKSKEYLEVLIHAAKSLEKAGADFLVIPCNTVHLFIKNVREAVSIPVLSIIDESIKFLKEKEIKSIALLATQNTVNSGLYAQPMNKLDIKVELPSQIDQNLMGSLISRLVNNNYAPDDKEKLIKIIDHLTSKNIEAVLLACTDLQLLTPQHPQVKIYDTMEILVTATAKEINN